MTGKFEFRHAKVSETLINVRLKSRDEARHRLHFTKSTPAKQ